MALTVLGVLAVIVLVLLPYRAPSVTTTGRVCDARGGSAACGRDLSPDFFAMTTTETFSTCVLGMSAPAQNVDFGTGNWHWVASSDSTCAGQYGLRWFAAGGVIALLIASRRGWRVADGDHPNRSPASTGLLLAIFIVAVGVVPFTRTQSFGVAGAVSADHPTSWTKGTQEISGVCGGLLGSPLYGEGGLVQPTCDSTRSGPQTLLLASLVTVESIALISHRRRGRPSKRRDAHMATPAGPVY